MACDRRRDFLRGVWQKAGLQQLRRRGLQSLAALKAWFVSVSAFLSFFYFQQEMRSRSSIQAVSLGNWTDKEGAYVPLKVEINSWVSLKPEKTGGHAKDAAKHGGTGIRGSYKARVFDFKMSPGGRALAAVQVQHAYMRRQLDLDNATAKLHPPALRCNCKFPHCLVVLF